MLPGVQIDMGGISTSVIEVTVTSGGALDLSTLFSASDWASAVPKRVKVPSGVVRTSSSPSTPAIKTGTGRGGTLEIVMEGEARGAGGLANSGVGGTALKIEQPGTTLRGSGGALKGGGGGGGKGGSGGGGYYYAWRTIQEGPAYSYSSHPFYNMTLSSGTWYGVYWNDQLLRNAPFSVPYFDGTWRYYPGAERQSFGSGSGAYEIYRQRDVQDVYTATSGGPGGNGGRGQGADGSAAAGSSGSAGGTNAGAGGTGGTGGAFGTNGGNGSNGAAGNAGAGVAGTTGGLAGFAIDGLANLTNSFTGTTLGRTQ